MMTGRHGCRFSLTEAVAIIIAAVITGVFGLLAVWLGNAQSPPSSLPATTIGAPIATVPPASFLPLDTLVADCQTTSFGNNDGYMTSVAGCEAEANGVTLGWRVAKDSSNAGCIVNLPAELRSLADYTVLELHVQGGHGGEKFWLGLSDAAREHKVLVEIPQSSAAGEPAVVSIPLSAYRQAQINLDAVQNLIFGFEYSLGEASRASSMCISQLGFSAR